MNYWLLVLKESAFKELLTSGLLGCRDPACGLLMTRVSRDDTVIVFVSGYGCRDYCKSFTGAFRVASDWHKAGGEYSYVVNVKPMITGKVGLGELVGKLSFMKGKKITDALHSVDPTYTYAKPMSKEDAELIIKMLSQGVTIKTASELIRGSNVITSRTDIIKLLRDIGELLGYYPVMDYKVGSYKLDLLWWEDEDAYKDGLAPLAVFERTEPTVDSALASIKHAHDRWRGLAAYIVTNDENEIESKIKGAFHELKGKIKIIKANEIEELYKDLSKHGDLIKQLIHIRRE